jgi:hypothetical protein
VVGTYGTPERISGIVKKQRKIARKRVKNFRKRWARGRRPSAAPIPRGARSEMPRSK